MKKKIEPHGRLIKQLYALHNNPKSIQEFKATVRKLENVLSSVDARFTAIAESTPDAVVICDQGGRVVFWNASAARIFGYSAQEMLGNSLMPIVVERNRKQEQALMDKLYLQGPAMLTGKTRESYAVRRDGTEFPIEVSNSFWRIGEELFFGAIIRDITKRRRLELERTRILDLSDDLICIASIDGYFKYVNPAWTRILGYSSRELLSRPFLDFICEEDHAKNIAEVESLCKGNPTVDFVNRYRHKMGHTLTVSWKATPVKEESLFYCIGRDMTAKIRADEALQESEERFRALAESSSDAICTTDQNGNINFWNSAAVAVLGYSREEVLGKNGNVLVPGRLKKWHATQGKQVRFMGLPAAGLKPFETTVMHKNGSEVSVEITMSGYTVRGLPHFSLIIRDISDRKIVEGQLKTQAQNLEESNAALRLLLKRRDEDKVELEQKMLSNINNLLIPYVDKLKIGKLDDRQRSLISIIETSLNEIIAPFSQKLISRFYSLTPSEIQVAGLVRDGRNSKEIAEIMNSSTRAVDFHRTSIRKKLGLNNQQANLRSYLLNNF